MQKILETIKTKEKNQDIGFWGPSVPVHRSLLSSFNNWNIWDTLKVLQFHNESIGGLYRHEIFEPNEKSLRPAFKLKLCIHFLIGRWKEFQFESLSSRHKAPGWWRDAKLGIFIHWGLYSVPGFAPTRYMFRWVFKMILFWLDDTSSQSKSFLNPFSERAAVDNATWFKYHPYAEWYINTQRIHGSPTWEFHRKHFGKLSYIDAFVPRFNKEII